MSLREALIEAGARTLALFDGWEWEQIPVSRERFYRQTASVLDAMLDRLGSLESEWIDDYRLMDAPLSSLIAELRNDL